MNSSQSLKAKNLTTDVVVIGGGGTGLAAALTASEKKARVILIEKKGIPGGNTAMAVGMFAAESPVQKRLSILAPKDDIFKIAMGYSHWRINPRIFRTFVERSGDTIRWLEEKGLTFVDVPSMYPGQAIRTWHCADMFKATGPLLVRLLRKHCEDTGVQLLTRCPAKKILTGDNGEVTGILAETEEGELKINAKSVIIATGGYGGNKQLLKRYFPSYSENMKYIGSPNVTGDGLLMATEIGASTEGLGTLMLHPPFYPRSAHVSTVAIQPSMVWVNKKGERFADEAITFHHIECGNIVNMQPDKITYSLFDEKLKNRIMEEGILTLGLHETGIYAGAKLTKLGKELLYEAERGDVKISDSWEEIAKWMGIAPEALKATIEEYNSFCDQGHDEIFAKDWSYLNALRTPPYYAIRCYLSFLTTLGGIKINHRMEVLNNQDKPILGLYAGGDAAGGWNADTYCMHLAGNAFSFAVNSGRIAGENAAKYVSGK